MYTTYLQLHVLLKDDQDRIVGYQLPAYPMQQPAPLVQTLHCCWNYKGLLTCSWIKTPAVQSWNRPALLLLNLSSALSSLRGRGGSFIHKADRTQSFCSFVMWGVRATQTTNPWILWVGPWFLGRCCQGEGGAWDLLEMTAEEGGLKYRDHSNSKRRR